MPSRNILHGRDVGSKSRIRVMGPGGSSGALWTCKKVKRHREHAGCGLLRDSLFLDPRMRSVSTFFAFGIFLWNSCSVSKIEGHREHAGFGLLKDPLLSGPDMRSVSVFFAFGMFLWNSWSVSKIKGHREHAGFRLLRDPLLLGSCMRSVSSFSLVGVPNDDAESDRRAKRSSGA